MKRKYLCVLLIVLTLNSAFYGCRKKNNQNVETNINTSQNLIKGNINSKGEKIYHVPRGQYYDVTKAEEWFKTEEEAQAAGYRKSKR